MCTIYLILEKEKRKTVTTNPLVLDVIIQLCPHIPEWLWADLICPEITEKARGKNLIGKNILRLKAYFSYTDNIFSILLLPPSDVKTAQSGCGVKRKYRKLL